MEKEKITKLKSFQGRDSFCRMNFLYQASMLMAGQNDVLSAYYGNLCKNIGKKSVLRIDPAIKRTLCKKCGLALKPGKTSQMKISESNKKLFQLKCSKCKFVKSYMVNNNYNFWLENPKCIVETYKGEKKRDNNLEQKTNGLSLKDTNRVKSKQ